MKNSWRTLKWAGALVALALAIFGIGLLRFGGAFRSVESAFAGQCRAIELGGSSDDVQIDREHGLAYLSLLDRATLSRGEAVNGTVMMLDLNLADPAPRAAMTFDPPNFRPLGISVLRRASEPARLFAVSNQPDGSNTVEIADQGSNGFLPRESIRDPAFVRPNGIAATGAREFYLAIDNEKALFRSTSAKVLYYDGAKTSIVAKGLNRVGGIALSADALRLYVAEPLAKALRIYRRDAKGGNLTLEETVSLDSVPANLDVDQDGVVWIAAHPKLFRFNSHLRNSVERAPTQVLRFDPRKSGEARVSEIYLDDGNQISAGTVAARWHDEFLIGALFDKKVLICKPNP